MVLLKKYRLPRPDCSGLLDPDVVAPVMLPGWPQIVARDRVLVPRLPGPRIHVDFYRATQYCKGVGVVVVRPVEMLEHRYFRISCRDSQHVELFNH